MVEVLIDGTPPLVHYPPTAGSRTQEKNENPVGGKGDIPSFFFVNASNFTTQKWGIFWMRFETAKNFTPKRGPKNAKMAKSRRICVQTKMAV